MKKTSLLTNDNTFVQITGIVDRVTYHNPDNGWSVLKVIPFDSPDNKVTVVVHQTKVFAGATMEFFGKWIVHRKYGRQFSAQKVLEKKPASASALEKYLGSGLIKGVGQKTAKKIVSYFKEKTLEIFEEDINRLTEVPGIAEKKLTMIAKAWEEHRSIRDVMMFLQSHGISTLFAVKIYKTYGDKAIFKVMANPYCLSHDIYGIGFFSADKVALSLGFKVDSPKRIMAGIAHVLSAAKDFGHCYLTFEQIQEQVQSLLKLEIQTTLPEILASMETEHLLMKRILTNELDHPLSCYYARSLFFDELYVAKRIASMGSYIPDTDIQRVQRWIKLFCNTKNLTLSQEQINAVAGIASCQCSILTGGPGCGKTTTTKVLVRLMEAMGMEVILTAPTGRAAQRMGEVIGKTSKTIHRLLGWNPAGGGFAKNQENPIDMDALIIDESSMLDINLTASLLKAVPDHGRVIFIGDFDQLPSVGAGNVLKDIMESKRISCFRLTKIFRQAAKSMIIRHAHTINKGNLPKISSPFHSPEVWKNKTDCLFMDSDQSTKEQAKFISRVKNLFSQDIPENACEPKNACKIEQGFTFGVEETTSVYETEFNIPKKFAHVDIDKLIQAQDTIEELKVVLKKVHPWSSLHYGLNAVDVVEKLYTKWIPKYYGNPCEIQILSPMIRGSLGTANLNQLIQEKANPARENISQIKAGQRIFRVGDRVIHRKNNYDLGVFNGDIGNIVKIDPVNCTCTIQFFPDNRQVVYQGADLMELELAYAITIHKSQGSEFEAVIIPVVTQHFKMLFRNLIYTGLTRAKHLAIFVGTRRALAMAVNNQDIAHRQTALKELLQKTKEI